MLHNIDNGFLTLIQTNLLSPIVLAFLLGIAAVYLRSDLKFPEPIYNFLSIYLLLAIGLKGGVTLSKEPLFTLAPLLFSAFMLSLFLPFFTFFCARLLRYTTTDSAAFAAHYGSVSVITFIACQVFVESSGYQTDKSMTAVLAIMEIPAIIIALILARTKHAHPFHQDIKKILTSKSILLLIGGIIMGYLSGEDGFQRISPLFVTPFQGMLVLFLLEMGLVTGHRLLETRHFPKSLFVIGFCIPILHGILGICLGKFMGLSIGNTTVFACLAASASYIAAPAAVRIALPNANPGYYLTASLAITFPFNLSFGIPLYHMMTVWFFK